MNNFKFTIDVAVLYLHSIIFKELSANYALIMQIRSIFLKY